MKKWFTVVAVLVLSSTAICAGCTSILFPGRELGTFEIGNNGRVRIWSELNSWNHAFPGVYYSVEVSGEMMVPRTFIGVDAGDDFTFRTASAEGGRIACVYEVNRATTDSQYFIIYDSATGASWPRHSEQHWQQKWRECYHKLRAAAADVPVVRSWEE
jgi:hypothetical protein